MKRKHAPLHTNNRQMNAALDYLYKRVDQITPSVYAAFAIALDARGWSAEQIAELFAETQEIWAESKNYSEDIVEICSERTGIEVRAGKEQ